MCVGRVGKVRGVHVLTPQHGCLCVCVCMEQTPHCDSGAAPLPGESLQGRAALCITIQEQTHQKPDPLKAPINVAVEEGCSERDRGQGMREAEKEMGTCWSRGE